MTQSKIIHSIEEVKHLQIPLRDISLATNEFSKENLIGRGGFGPVYKGISEKHGRIAVKRLDRRNQGDIEFKTEIALLSKYKHENIVSLLGFCDADGEKILVYKYESNGSLDKHLNNKDLSWNQRFQICLDVARGLKHVLDNDGSQQGVFHRDVKSSNILLDENWKAKISDFGLSRVRPEQDSFLFSHPCGTKGYIDPDYQNDGYLTQKTDVYSFGVVLFEVLCGRLSWVASYDDDRRHLTVLARKHYGRKSLDRIIPSYLLKQISPDSLDKFSKIAYECLKHGEERPTMEQVVEQLKKALAHLLEVKKLEEEDVKLTANDGEHGEDSKDPPRQEIVLRTFMHCQSCARKVKRCLKGYEGVVDVVTDCETHKVIVKGEKADPIKVLERVQNKCHRKVELLSPVRKPSAEVSKELNLEEPSKSEEKKHEKVTNPEEEEETEEEAKSEFVDEKMEEESIDPLAPPSPQEIVLNVYMHCEDCARKVRGCLKGFEVVEDVVTYCETQKVVVKGKNADPRKVLDRVQKNCHRKVELILPVQKLLKDEPKQEKPPKKGLKSWLQKNLW